MAKTPEEHKEAINRLIFTTVSRSREARAKDRAYYLENKDRIQAYAKAYREKNRDRINEYARKWREQNREKVKGTTKRDE